MSELEESADYINKPDYTDFEPTAVERWRDRLQTKPTPNNNARDAFEIQHTGPDNFLVQGGGEQVWADGIRPSDGLLLDAKCIDNPGRSPFIPTSKCPDFIRQNAIEQVDDELRRYAAVIADPATPVRGLEVIISDLAAKPLFESLLKKYGIPGRVVLP